MQKFWYHSPVRFYKTKEELFDMTNPQNTQYFGHKKPYPLQINEYHRFLIPNYQNEVEFEDLELWLVGDQETQIPCEFGINEGKLFRITFISFDFNMGQFEIRIKDGDTIFYSNCVEFLDSTDAIGRKFIRIATKHYYNKNLFAFDNSNYDWVVTNLPAYCLGQFTIDSEFETERTGNENSLAIADSYIDEVVTYEFEGAGDANIFSFLIVHVLNDTFYIDGTKRTIKEKPDVDEFAAYGRFKFVNAKDELGLNIPLNEEDIFSDAFKLALGNGAKTLLYVYNNNTTAIPTT
ncbi:hypothetical protein [Chryseobacterium daeguense]|uniref:hypothetical protein n=1 Tax=Chryseobacterium daeguense TaxID=412438 RepID=UPI00041E30EA|nr:hypothetical protein [Chryseobacterium daeguense]